MSVDDGGRRTRRRTALLAGLALALLMPAAFATAAQASVPGCEPGAQTASVGRYWWMDRFDDLQDGPLANQNGWTAGNTNPAGAHGITVGPHPNTGPGAKKVRIDAPAGTEYVCKDLPDRHSGLHVVQLDAKAEGTMHRSVGQVELLMGSSGAVNLHIGSTIRLESTAATGPHTIVVPNTSSREWHHISIEFNLDTDRLAVSANGVPIASGIRAPSGAIKSVKLRGREDPGFVELDNLSASPVAAPWAMWASEDFESLSLGPLNGQHGWSATPDVMVRPRTAGGQVLWLANPANTSINWASKDVADQSTGRHRFSFDTFAFAASPSDAKIEMGSTTQNPEYQRLWQFYIGTSMRINYGPNPADTATIVTDVAPTWYHVDMVMNLAAARMTVTVTGAGQTRRVTVPIQRGAIKHMTLWSWPRGGWVVVDNIDGRRLSSALTDR